MARTERWMQKLKLKKGALRKQLGIKAGQKIPMATLNKILKTEIGEKISINGKTIKVTSTLKKRANLAKIFKSVKRK